MTAQLESVLSPFHNRDEPVEIVFSAREMQLRLVMATIEQIVLLVCSITPKVVQK